MRQGLFVLFSTAILLLPMNFFGAVIAENGQSVYDIVIRADAPKTTRYAADELKTYLKKVAGAKVKILKVKT